MTEEKYEIELTFVGHRGETIIERLGEGEYLMGRHPECKIVFPKDDATISQKHARLAVARGETVIEDLDSESGIMVGGRIVRRKALQNRDMIAIGDWNIRVVLPEVQGTTQSEILRITGRGAEDSKGRVLHEELQNVRAGTRKLMDEIAKRIVGQHSVLQLVWATILAQGHCLLIGVPGLAKTFMVTTFAEALGINFSRIQFTPDLMPADILGSQLVQDSGTGKREFEFVQGPVFAQLILADEINRTPPKTQAALLEAMQERQVTIANKTFKLPRPFCVIASQNPIEQEGTYPLPEAQLDRFLMCVTLDYPDREQEQNILARTSFSQVAAVEQVFNYEMILRYQEIVDRIAITREAVAYAADLARSTRPTADNPHEDVRRLVDWGAGPRAGQSLIRVAKALAAMDGRPGISVADLKDVALPVLRHRIGCNYRARAENVTVDGLIQSLMKRMK